MLNLTIYKYKINKIPMLYKAKTTTKKNLQTEYLNFNIEDFITFFFNTLFLFFFSIFKNKK